MSAWVRPVCGLAYTMLSIFIASTRFSDGTDSPVNGDRIWRASDGAGACAQAASSALTRPASTTAAVTGVTALCLIHLTASSRTTHLVRMRHHSLGSTTVPGTKRATGRQSYASGPDA